MSFASHRIKSCPAFRSHSLLCLWQKKKLMLKHRIKSILLKTSRRSVLDPMQRNDIVESLQREKHQGKCVFTRMCSRDKVAL